jgi:hypothetical protein
VDVAKIAAVVTELEGPGLALHCLPLLGFEEIDNVPVELNALRDLVVTGIENVPIRGDGDDRIRCLTGRLLHLVAPCPMMRVSPQLTYTFFSSAIALALTKFSVATPSFPK